MEMIENREVHKWAEKRTTLATLDREYDFNDIAIITRASPAKIDGYTDRGALTPGYKADIAVYDIKPNEFDPSKNPKEVEKAFSRALYTIKDGQILVKDGEIVQTKPSHTIWTNVTGLEDEEARVLEEIMPFFKQYYSVKWSNYKVHDHYVPNPIQIDVPVK
jgi:formylmethanofuran dehydrogenase subunit A